MTHLPEYITKDSVLSNDLISIGSKVYQGNRISPEDGVTLFNDAPLAFLGHLANFIREKRHGNVTYFNRNFHIEPTNVCVYDCKFCSYSRKIKKREDGWEYTADQMLDIVKSYDSSPVTEVHIVGGVLPQYDLEFYENLFSTIRGHRPELHIKALTPVEYHYVFKKAGITYEEGMKRMKDAGLASMPGGGAEIFHPDIREVICKDKCDAEQWLEIHRIWHQLGMRSNATILYGHIEEYHHRVDHMERLRQLQDETGGFQTFIPLKFRNKDNQMSDLEEQTSLEDLRNYAISRIYLDNFDHIKAYWPMIGRATAQLSLAFGVDDIDGTIDDTTKIYTMAGSEEQNPALTTEEMVNLIKIVGRKPVERGTLYNVVKDYSEVVFESDNDYQGYMTLPVVESANHSDRS